MRNTIRSAAGMYVALTLWFVSIFVMSLAVYTAVAPAGGTLSASPVVGGFLIVGLAMLFSSLAMAAGWKAAAWLIAARENRAPSSAGQHEGSPNASLATIR